MKYFLGIFGFLVVVVLVLAMIGMVAPIVEVGERLQAAIDRSGGVERLAEPAIELLIDGLNESGFDRRPLDPAEPLLTQRTILISESINERVASHVIERLLHLNGVDPKADIELHVVTSGGWLDSAFAIVDTMRSIDAPVNVKAVGGCYSAGTVILAAGTGKRTATPNAILSVHVNDFYREGDPFDCDTQELRRFRRVYERFSKVPGEWFDEPGDNQYYFDAEQALEMELIDRIDAAHWEAPEVDDETLLPAV